jgi:hypothetical protein
VSPVRLPALSVILLILLGGVARADGDCRGGSPARPFVTCFDPGNRLVLEGGYGGVGGELALRQVVHTDDRSVTWRFEHRLLRANFDGELTTGALYSASFLRHSSDGHLVLPTSPPRKIFVPVDFGVTLGVGGATWRTGEDLIELDVIHLSPVIELLRSGSWHHRLTIGPRVRWDVDFDVVEKKAVAYVVAPFTEGELAFHLESDDGLTVLDVSAHGGSSWASDGHWGTAYGGEVSIERVLLGFNDVPLSAYARASWQKEDPRADAGTPRGAYWGVGLRLGLGSAR